MIKKWLNKLINKVFRKQYKKLNDLQKSVDRMEKILKEQEAQLKEQKKQLNQQKKQINEQTKFIEEQFAARDYWEIRSAEIKHLAKGKKIWVIKCPASDTPDKSLWGPYNFSMDLKRELEARGYYVVIDWYNNWYGRIDADYVLVLRGVHDYRPDRRVENCKYILWHNCYPHRVTDEEYSLYDLIVVNSYTFVDKIKERVDVPVKPLLLCADVEKFFPREDEIKYDKVFVGNTRFVHRNVATWCENHNIPLHLWGRMEGKSRWQKYVKEDTSIILEGPMPNEELPDIYRASKIILNDHYDDMREEGFINNRILEALSCGRPVLSDWCEEYERLFGDSLVYYYDEEDFLEKLKWLDEHSEEQKEKVMAIWPKLREEYSFAARAEALIEMVNELD